MCRKLFFGVSFAMVLGLAASTAVADLVAYYPLDEGSGNTATDASGNGHNGTLNGDPRWIAGKFGQALEFPGTAGSCVDLGTWNPSEGTDQLTVALWVKWNGLSGQWQGLISKRNSWGPAPIGEMMWFLEANQTNGVLWFGRREGGGVGSSGQTLPEGEWQHLAITCDGTTATMYRDGEQLNSGSFTLGSMTDAGLQIGSGYINGGGPFNGAVDDVRIYNNALTPEELLSAMQGAGAYPYAMAPTPADGVYHPDTWVNLSWRAGDLAVSHDVYLGENFDDVDTGAGGTFQGNQTATSFNVGLPGGPYPDGLVQGTTYYWRIDEVEADGTTVHKGDVWSFTTGGRGLQGKYYQWSGQYTPSRSAAFSNLVMTRVDPTINFNWGLGAPDPLVNADNFSVRWTGEVEAGFTETYTFYTNTDDGVRLWVDGQQLVDDWTEHPATENSGKIDLVAGQTYNIVMEMFENRGGAVAQLRWSSLHTPKQLIPQAALSPGSLAGALDTALSLTTGGSADWFPQTTTSRYDGDAAQSGDISHRQESWIQTTVSGTGTVKFYWKVSSEEDCDFLEFYIDGSLQEKTSGSVNWQQKRYTISTPGSHTLEWRYMKDVGSDSGSDCGWVDKVEW